MKIQSLRVNTAVVPELRVDTDGQRLLDRVQELADLRAMLRPIGRSYVGMMLIEGEYGVGKTALLNSACAMSSAFGGNVLRARASKQEQTHALGVVNQILAQLYSSESLSEESRRRIGRVNIDALSETGLLDIYHELDEMLVHHAGTSFVAIAIDDVHLADPASLGWIRFLSRRVNTFPVAVFLTSLPPRNILVQHPLDPIIAESSARRIELRPLSTEAVGRLVQSRFGADKISSQLDAACFEATRGNPALLFALLDHLSRTATSHDADDLVERVRSASPRQVVRSIVHRVTSTGSESMAVIQAIALLDGVAELADIAEVSQVDVATVATAVERITEAGILEAAEPLRFVHPLVRSALIGAIPKVERSALHARCVHALKLKGGFDMIVASHLLETAPVGSAIDTDILLTAGRQALHDGFPDTAARYLARAKSELAVDLMTGQQLVEIAELHAHLHQPEAMDLLARASQQISDPERLIPIVFALTETRGAPGLHEARGLLHRVRDRTFETLAVTRIDLALGLLDGPEHHQPMPAPRVGDAPLMRALRTIETMADPKGSSALALGGVLEQCIDAIHLASPDPVPFQVGHRALIAMIRIDRPRLAERLVADAIELLGDDDVASSSRLLRLRSELAVRQGDLVLAQSCRDLAEQRWSQSAWGFAAVDACWDAKLAALQGDTARASEILVAVEPSEFDADPFLVPEMLGWLALVDGDAAAATTHFDSAAQLAERCGVRNPAITSWRSGCARAFAMQGDLRSAHDVARVAVDLARTFGAPGPLAHALGSLASSQPDNLVELLNEAVVAADQSGDVLVMITTRLELGRTLRRSGNEELAINVLRIAGDIAFRFQSPIVSSAVMSQLRACGSRPVCLALHGVESLTPAQLRTVRLAAEGATNIEIAATLFVSIKTVESHLARAYRKLGVKTRTELTAVLDQT